MKTSFRTLAKISDYCLFVLHNNPPQQEVPFLVLNLLFLSWLKFFEIDDSAMSEIDVLSYYAISQVKFCLECYPCMQNFACEHDWNMLMFWLIKI
jgi:hypothetical protein